MTRSSKSKLESREFADEMRLVRGIMDKDWVLLRALALGDQYPDLDVEARLKMARQQARDRKKPIGN